LNKITGTWQILKTILYITSVLAFFLVSIDLLVTSLSYVGKDTVRSVLEVTANPFISLFIGLLVTALIQSSSTTTSMIVAMVASGSLEMQQAIPMIMGANIGTTITSNIVSLSYITNRQVFGRAFSSATIHDHFNILTTIVLFPLQLKYNFLGLISIKVASFLTVGHFDAGEANFSMFKLGNLVVNEWIIDFIGNPLLVLVLSVILLFVSIKLFTRIIYKLFLGSGSSKVEKLIFKNPFKSFGWGAVITASLQSSSVTTSFIVPLVATSKIQLKHIYPFIVGANIGTTVTALLAALFKSPEAISIAVAHLLFNLLGGVIFLLIPGLNRLPLFLTNFLASLTLKFRLISVIYIIITFFLLPFAFIYLTK
jgi:sodium-dependent phosphate cotransporter